MTDLHSECARTLLTGKIRDVEAFIDEAPTKGNPNADNISRPSSSLGFPGVLDGVRWQKMSSGSVKDRLRKLNELRNKIVHGKSETVRKVQVTHLLDFVRRFSEKLDEEVGAAMSTVLGRSPW